MSTPNSPKTEKIFPLDKPGPIPHTGDMTTQQILPNIFDAAAEPARDGLEDGQRWEWNPYVEPACWVLKSNPEDPSKAHLWYLNRAQERAAERAMKKVFVVPVPPVA